MKTRFKRSAQALGGLEVFKLQRELELGSLRFKPNGNVLAYNEDRSVFGQFPATPETDALFARRPKIYVMGRRLPDGRLETSDILVEGQDW